ncbi:MAG: hypothetical protein A2079_07520 [Geobacteraceae bacterium GWC2_48_7]|nr:MAG: hypothetical protein A2079_07520 [Geobacteraceae bacterium GWC2_48_7]
MLKQTLPIIRYLLLMAFITCYSAPAVAETLLENGGMVIKADVMTHDQNANIVKASGNVLLEWKGMSLTSAELSFNQLTEVITASGNVVLTRGEDILKGDRLVLDTVSGKGEMDNSELTIRQAGNFHLAGKKITRDSEEEIRVQEGSLTTCDAKVPAWKFGAEELNVNLLGYGTGKNVVFYIKDKPVLYLPWIAFPVVRDRQSGFLFPRVGWSNKKGAELDLLYYWAISPSQDLTLNLDSLTKRGVGTGVDYRYLRSRNSQGDFGGYLIYDLMQDRWRGQVNQKHKEIFSPEMNLRATINLTSDRNFLNDYGDKSGDYNRQTNDSTVNFLKTWQNYALTANMRYTEDYYAVDNSRTLQTLPEIGLAAVRQQLFSTPLFFDLDLTASNFYREKGSTGQRLSALPRLTLISGIPGYLNASAFAGVRLRAYNTDNIPAGETIDRNNGKALPEAGARISSVFSRIYEVNGESLKKMRHELTPEISYYYSPDQEQSSLPLYDFTDRLIHQNTIYFGLTSHLGGKFQQGDTAEYRDISKISLLQGYSLEGTRRDLLTAVDDNRPWGDLILTSETWLHQRAKFNLDSRYNLYDNRFNSVAPGLEFDNGMGSSAAVYYRFSRNFVEYLEARLSTKAIKSWTFGYTARYSFDRNEFLETVYSTEYRHQCWSVSLAFRDRPGNQSYLVNFNLAGLTGI